MGVSCAPKVCLVLPKIVSPLRGKPILFPGLGSPVPTASSSAPPPPAPHLFPGLGAAGATGGCEVEDFPDSNCKAPHFDFPWWEERPGLCFPWLQPRLKENVGSKTAPQSHLPHTLSSRALYSPGGSNLDQAPPLTFQMSISLQVFRKQKGGSSTQKLGF